jgi:hypothetical protein
MVTYEKERSRHEGDMESRKRTYEAATTDQVAENREKPNRPKRVKTLISGPAPELSLQR